jgi:hypothetical protein
MPRTSTQDRNNRLQRHCPVPIPSLPTAARAHGGTTTRFPLEAGDYAALKPKAATAAVASASQTFAEGHAEERRLVHRERDAHDLPEMQGQEHAQNYKPEVGKKPDEQEPEEDDTADGMKDDVEVVAPSLAKGKRATVSFLLSPVSSSVAEVHRTAFPKVHFIALPCHSTRTHTSSVSAMIVVFLVTVVVVDVVVCNMVLLLRLLLFA